MPLSTFARTKRVVTLCDLVGKATEPLLSNLLQRVHENQLQAGILRPAVVGSLRLDPLNLLGADLFPWYQVKMRGSQNARATRGSAP